MKKFRKLLGILTSLVLTITPLIAGAFSATAYEQAYLQSGKIYRIKYKDSGKYLTVCNGLDADGVNIIQKDLDGTLSQQFRVVYDSASDAYRIYAMCSSNGNGRVLQIYAPLGVEAGCNVELKSQSDTDLQLWKVDFYYGVRADLCYIFTKNSNKILTATAGNGSQYGTAPESAGNVWIKIRAVGALKLSILPRTRNPGTIISEINPPTIICTSITTPLIWALPLARKNGR